jgi:hypothetical protein
MMDCDNNINDDNVCSIIHNPSDSCHIYIHIRHISNRFHSFIQKVKNAILKKHIKNTHRQQIVIPHMNKLQGALERQQVDSLVGRDSR